MSFGVANPRLVESGWLDIEIPLPTFLRGSDRISGSTVDGISNVTIRPAYSMWPQYNRRLRKVVVAMTD